MARFKKGQTVWYGRGKFEKELIIERVHKNPLLPIHQYTFEAPNNGWACGEQSLRDTQDGRDLTLRECMVDDKEMEFRVNTLANAMRNIVGERESGLRLSNISMFDSIRVDFRPNIEMCNWLKEYANGRLIFHIDSGQGHLVRMLRQFSNARAVGIEPNINKSKMLELRAVHRGLGDTDINEILEGNLSDYVNLIKKAGDKALVLFTRPKDNDNLILAISEFFGKSEIILIDTKTDIDSKWPRIWKKLEHRGCSEDDEIVYSLKI